jgi:hypothetical protein
VQATVLAARYQLLGITTPVGSAPLGNGPSAVLNIRVSATARDPIEIRHFRAGGDDEQRERRKQKFVV